MVYKREKESNRYSTWDRDDKQTSWIKLDRDLKVTVTRSGNIDHPYAVHKYGYWAWERFAEELPLDYSPLGGEFRWAGGRQPYIKNDFASDW